MPYTLCSFSRVSKRKDNVTEKTLRKRGHLCTALLGVIGVEVALTVQTPIAQEAPVFS